MSSFSLFKRADSQAIGFIVDCGWRNQVFYVDRDSLSVSPTSVMLKDGYVEQSYEWYEDRAFLWGEPKTTSLIKKFECRVNIEEVTEVPDWVGKVYEDIQKEIKVRKEELRKKKWFYKLTHFFAKKEK